MYIIYNVAQNIQTMGLGSIFCHAKCSLVFNGQDIFMGNRLGTLKTRTFLKMLSKELVAERLTRQSVKTVGMP